MRCFSLFLRSAVSVVREASDDDRRRERSFSRRLTLPRTQSLGILQNVLEEESHGAPFVYTATQSNTVRRRMLTAWSRERESQKLLHYLIPVPIIEEVLVPKIGRASCRERV